MTLSYSTPRIYIYRNVYITIIAMTMTIKKKSKSMWLTYTPEVLGEQELMCLLPRPKIYVASYFDQSTQKNYS